MFRAAVKSGVHRPVAVYCKSQIIAFIAHRLECSKTGCDYVNHYVLASCIADHLSPAEHFPCLCSYVDKVTFPFACFLFCHVPLLQAFLHPFAERIEILVCEILIVLEQIYPAYPRLVSSFGMLFVIQSYFWLGDSCGNRPFAGAKYFPDAGNPKLRPG